ncbi:MAG: hypothetical protein MJ082_02940, partial [Clostridia bacterium]|nr:hypothetical protein [Clostridia bacterium]
MAEQNNQNNREGENRQKNGQNGGFNPKKKKNNPNQPQKPKPAAEDTEAKESFPPIEGDVVIIGINFKEAGKIYYFAPGETQFAVGDRVIVETARGTEIGTVKIANKTVAGKTLVPPLKPVVRRATKEDLEHDEKNRRAEFDAAIVCKRKIAEHKLDMKLVCAEYTFDNTKLTFYFTCETRVDFRQLVKDLASTFRTRIELRQIGIRDETKLIGGLGVCGRKYCCAGF